MKFSSFLKSKPMQWSIIIFVLAQALTLLVISHEDVFLKKDNIYIPPPADAGHYHLADTDY